MLVIDDTLIDFKIPKNIAKTYVNNKRTNYSFKFNSIIDQQATQEDVFDTIAKVLMNDSSCSLCYNAFCTGEHRRLL